MPSKRDGDEETDSRGTASRALYEAAKFVPRSDLQAEKALLGAVMLEPAIFALVVKLVASADFFAPHHGLIWEAICWLVEQGRPIDIVTMADRLRAMDRLATVGGTQYLGELTETLPIAEHAAAYADIVAEHSRVRKIAEAVKTVWMAASDTSYTHDAIMSLVDQEMSKITAAVDSQEVGSAADEIQECIEQISTGEAKLTSYPTRIPRLDRITKGGAHPGHIWLIGGRPGTGKTSLAVQIAVEIALRYPVLFFSLEQPKKELLYKIIASIAEVDSMLINEAKNDPAMMAKIYEATQITDGLRLYIDDTPELSAGAIRSRVRAARQRWGIVAVFIDYIQLIKVSDRSNNRDQALGDASRGLKVMAKQEEVALIELAQLNRKIEDRADPTPKLSDFRESGSFEGDADVAMILARQNDRSKDGEDEETDDIDGCLLKNRHGPTGVIPMWFHRPFTRFREQTDDPNDRPGGRATPNPSMRPAAARPKDVDDQPPVEADDGSDRF